MRRFFRRATLEDLSARGDARRLLRALAPRDSDMAETEDGLLDLEWGRREEAARLLGRLPGQEVTDALVTALNDYTADVRLSALRSLVARADAREAEMVLAVLSWDEPDARRSGGELLVERADADDAAATRIVVAYVGNGGAPDHLLDDDWARVAFGGIAGASRKATMEHVVQRWLEQLDGMNRARQVIRAEEELGVDVLLTRLERDPRRLPAAALLGELRNARATEALIGLLRAVSPAERATAAQALGQVQDPRAVSELLRVSADPVFAVRDAAQRGLDALGTAGVVWSVVAAAQGVLEGTGQLLAPEDAQRLLGAPDQAS